MPVFDFNATPDEKKPAECTYTVIRSNENEATIEKPMMIPKSFLIRKMKEPISLTACLLI